MYTDAFVFRHVRLPGRLGPTYAKASVGRPAYASGTGSDPRKPTASLPDEACGGLACGSVVGTKDRIKAPSAYAGVNARLVWACEIWLRSGPPRLRSWRDLGFNCHAA